MVDKGSRTDLQSQNRPKRVKATAYMYADGGLESRPDELTLYSAIETYGADAVMGRPLGAWEIRFMNLANNILYAYRSKSRAESQAEWAQDHKDQEELLADALMTAIEQGYNPNA